MVFTIPVLPVFGSQTARETEKSPTSSGWMWSSVCCVVLCVLLVGLYAMGALFADRPPTRPPPMAARSVTNPTPRQTAAASQIQAAFRGFRVRRGVGNKLRAGAQIRRELAAIANSNRPSNTNAAIAARRAAAALRRASATSAASVAASVAAPAQGSARGSAQGSARGSARGPVTPGASGSPTVARAS